MQPSWHPFPSRRHSCAPPLVRGVCLFLPYCRVSISPTTNAQMLGGHVTSDVVKTSVRIARIDSIQLSILIRKRRFEQWRLPDRNAHFDTGQGRLRGSQ